MNSADDSSRKTDASSPSNAVPAVPAVPAMAAVPDAPKGRTTARKSSAAPSTPTCNRGSPTSPSGQDDHPTTRDQRVHPPVQQRDVIALNIGGTKMHASRSTLCQIEGSLLSVMFGGDWEQNVTKDEKGRVFLDYNPVLFGVILNWLRSLTLAEPNAVIPELKIERHLEEDLLILVEYMQLQSHVPMSYTETFSVGPLRSSDMMVQDASAWRNGFDRGRYAVVTSAHAFFDVCVELTLEVLHFAATEVLEDEEDASTNKPLRSTNLPMFVGFTPRIVLEECDLDGHKVTHQKGTYGWWTRSGETHRVVDGKTQRETGGNKRLWSRGDSLLLTLDCRKQAASGVRVTLTNLTRSVAHQLDVPSVGPIVAPADGAAGTAGVAAATAAGGAAATAATTAGGGGGGSLGDKWVLMVGMTCPEDKVRISGARRLGLRGGMTSGLCV